LVCRCRAVSGVVSSLSAVTAFPCHV